MGASLQSALAPDGPQADAVATLAWVMFIGGALIFVLVMGLLAHAMYGTRRGWLADRRTIIAGGIIFPVVVLTALLVYGLALTRAITADPSRAVEINVIGEQFWWRVQYRLDGETIESANELHIPVGRPVRLSLTTTDVIHSFWVPRLAGKLDMIPGQTNRLTLQADKPGVFRGQCAEYCGAAHALMAFDVIANPEFDTWLAAQRRPAQESIYPFEQRGKALFLSSGCGACHTVRGTPADGKLGPDLTHIGSRRSIGAGSFPNNKGTLAGWIADTQHLKPESRMPSFNVFTGEELRAVAAYLESLK